MIITWYGTASLKFKSGNSEIQFDPFYPMNGNLRQSIDWSDGFGTNILVTHNHFDHTVDIPDLLRDASYTLYCSEDLAIRLEKYAVRSDQIQILYAGQKLFVDSTEIDVYHSRHSSPGWRLKVKTFLHPRVLVNIPQLLRLLKVHGEHPCGPIFAYHFLMDHVRVLHLGSMDIDPDVSYPSDVDLLSLPYQGCSDLVGQAIKIISLFNPRTVLLHHFDDSFPPISRTINTNKLIQKLRKCIPDINVIVPEHGKPIPYFQNNSPAL